MSTCKYNTRFTLLFAAFLIAATQSYAADLPAIDLPAMYTGDHVAFLKHFPLYKTTIADVITAYGQPKMAIDGAVKNRDIWTYYQKSTVYVFYFAVGRVYDITISDTSNHWTSSTLSAHELQSKEEGNNAN